MTDPIVLFDGVCNLCNGAVTLVIAHDSAGRFRFASMQSAAGAKLLLQAGRGGGTMDTIVVVDGSRVLVQSDAVLAIAARLDWPWRLLGVFRVVPRRIRDLAYRVVARRRYRLFGRKDACMIPSPELRDRFLE